MDWNRDSFDNCVSGPAVGKTRVFFCCDSRTMFRIRVCITSVGKWSILMYCAMSAATMPECIIVVADEIRRADATGICFGGEKIINKYKKKKNIKKKRPGNYSIFVLRSRMAVIPSSRWDPARPAASTLRERRAGRRRRIGQVENKKRTHTGVEEYFSK